MGDGAAEVYTCYCDEEIKGKDLDGHFGSCPQLSLSRLHKVITELLSELENFPKYTYFLEREMIWELKRVQSRLRKKCAECGSTGMTDGVSLECRHSFCRQHAPAGPCPICVPPSHLSCHHCGDSTSPSITLSCSHVFCHSHIQEVFASTFARTGELPCPLCGIQMQHPELKAVMGEEIVDSALLRLAFPDEQIVICPKCGFGGVLEPGEIDYRVKDAKGRVYSKLAAETYSKYRFSCPKCRTSICANCSVSPYHDALTCEQQERLRDGRCRYCEELPPVKEDCCEMKECRETLELTCRQRLPCGHRCFGKLEDEVCSPCLVEGCDRDMKTTESEKCCLCQDKLRTKPVVELECGHFVHHQCLKDTLHRRWPGARITFKFCKCPLCQDWAVAKYNTELQREIGKYQLLFEQIKARGFEMLRREPAENKRINDPHDSAYYNQPEKYVIDRFCFYECYRCNQTYFGGKKECEDNTDQVQDPRELLCPNCISDAPGVKNCSKHGIDFIEYKCRFCCSVAVYYCWGTTHFCEACHKRHNDGEDLAKRRRDQLPRCLGVGQCPLHVRHPPNGTEFILGCRLCRNGES